MDKLFILVETLTKRITHSLFSRSYDNPRGERTFNFSLANVDFILFQFSVQSDNLYINILQPINLKITQISCLHRMTSQM